MRNKLFLVLALALIGFLFYGEPSFTGEVLYEESCGELGCFEMCFTRDDCNLVETCCPYENTGICFDESDEVGCLELLEVLEKEPPVFEEPIKPLGMGATIFAVIIATLLIYFVILRPMSD